MRPLAAIALVACLLAGCSGDSDEPEATTSVETDTVTTTPEPVGEPCSLDYGNGIAVGKAGPATFTCAGDTPF